MHHDKKEIQQSQDTVKTLTWKWRRWDLRKDGKVFWQYCRGKERWVTWESALRNWKNILKGAKKSRLQNPEKHKALNKKWREENREKHRENARSWGKRNRKRCAANKRARDNHRRQHDPTYAIQRRLRSRIRNAMKDGGLKKQTSTYDILGADYKTVKEHLESQFIMGMSWDNRNEWHIDHIIPLSSAKDEAGLLKLCHYTNLQPLWAVDNLKKGAQHHITKD